GVLGVLEQLVPAGALVGLGSSAEHRDAEGGVDVLTVHQEVRGAFGHGDDTTRCRARGRRCGWCVRGPSARADVRRTTPSSSGESIPTTPPQSRLSTFL